MMLLKKVVCGDVYYLPLAKRMTLSLVYTSLILTGHLINPVWLIGNNKPAATARRKRFMIFLRLLRKIQ